jgi:hypothetical protein
VSKYLALGYVAELCVDVAIRISPGEMWRDASRAITRVQPVKVLPIAFSHTGYWYICADLMDRAYVRPLQLRSVCVD